MQFFFSFPGGLKITTDGVTLGSQEIWMKEVLNELEPEKTVIAEDETAFSISSGPSLFSPISSKLAMDKSDTK